jgi:thiamine biosynthesis lipoprotein
MTSPETNRRDFLTGRAAARSAESFIEGATGSADKELAPPAAAGQATYLLEVGRRAMACDFQVLVNAGQYQQAPEYALEALDLVEQLEGQLTIFRDTSEISHLNRTAAQQPVKVAPHLYQLLKQAYALYEQTSGALPVQVQWRTLGHQSDRDASG